MLLSDSCYISKKEELCLKKEQSSEHTKHKYDECFAKIVLEEFFPNKYKNLIIKDKPDLVDESSNIGIEVVNAIPVELHETESCLMKIQSQMGKNGKREYE